MNYMDICGKDKIKIHNAKNDVYTVLNILNEMQIFFVMMNLMRIKRYILKCQIYLILINRKSI